MGALRGMVKGGEVTSTTMSTYQMSEEQKRDQTIDYISGFEIIDDQRRLFVLEGLTHSGMTQMELIIKSLILSWSKSLISLVAISTAKFYNK